MHGSRRGFKRPGPQHDVREVLTNGSAAPIVPQFTLYGDVREGRHPSFIAAAKEPLPRDFVRARWRNDPSTANRSGIRGVWRAHMDVDLLNDGPVTILLDSKRAC